MTSNNDLRSYSVVAHIPDNSTIAVVIDNDEHHLHPLRHASNVNTHLLYTGEAPRPTNCYSYVIMKDGIITQREPSTRSISGTSSSSTTTTTTYDFFDRVPKIEHVAQLPRLYGPLFKEKPNELHKPGQIATLHLTGNQDDFDTLHKRYQEQIKIEVSMSYIGANDIMEFDSVQLKLSGRASRWMSKLSYGVKLPKGARLYGHRHLKLRALATDPSYLREYLSYKSIKASGLPCSDFSFVRVFINNQAIGLFGLIEVYKKPWLKDVFGDNKVNILYQGLGYSKESNDHNQCADLKYNPDLESYNHDQYKIKVAGKNDDGYQSLQSFTKTIVDGTWMDHANVESFLRSYALEIVAGFSDAYMSMADNYFVYKHKDGFVHIMSDVDMTFGQTTLRLEKMLTGDYRQYPGIDIRPMSKYILDNADLSNQLQQKVNEMASQLVNPEIMRPVIDDVYRLIEQDVAWDKQLPRMGQNHIATNTTTYDRDNLPFWVHPPIEPDVLDDFNVRMRNDDVGFYDAVYGKPPYTSLTGVLDYITKSSNAILTRNST
ncbi:hypothetical protein O0I10_003977 [Lichtheimia ornata]|uniref:Coth-domain-containing protein n=1 Tax=Lichtheimia ornata TaxID=688661 RepID=A0AAD7V7N5_9FUNG|nr:uncharacterized protein O0I10_003977 [Lichtheimia ornata]KAJ8660118.1 hypothetical protein O0I10_003977 [Lichtheimia ornata]